MSRNCPKSALREYNVVYDRGLVFQIAWTLGVVVAVGATSTLEGHVERSKTKVAFSKDNDLESSSSFELPECFFLPYLLVWRKCGSVWRSTFFIKNNLSQSIRVASAVKRTTSDRGFARTIFRTRMPLSNQTSSCAVSRYFLTAIVMAAHRVLFRTRDGATFLSKQPHRKLSIIWNS